MRDTLKFVSDGGDRPVEILRRLLKGKDPNSIEVLTARSIVLFKVKYPDMFYRKAREQARDNVARSFNIPSNFTHTRFRQKFGKEIKAFQLGCEIAQKALGISSAR